MATMTALERAWCVSVPHHPRGAGVARARICSELASQVSPDTLDDAVTVTAELVGNAIRHALPLPGDVVRVSWRVRYTDAGGDVTVTVTDGGSGRHPTVRHVGPESLDGRGLAIVEALTDSWGVERDGLGQSVWADIRRSR